MKSMLELLENDSTLTAEQLAVMIGGDVEEIKELIRNLSKTYPELKARVFGAMQRLPLPEWEVIPHKRVSQKIPHKPRE